MNECLVTKLKSSIEDDSLLKLGEVRIKIKAGTRMNFYSPEKDIEVRVLDGTFDDGTKIAHPVNGLIEKTAMANSDIVVSLISKYDVESINYKGDAMTDMTYMSKLKSLWSGNINNFDISPSNILVRIGGNKYDVPEMQGITKYVNEGYFPNLTSFSVIDFNGAVNGASAEIFDIVKCFGKCINLTTGIFRAAPISGSIESLAAAQVANGRIEGTLTIDTRARDMTYQGNACGSGDNYKITFGASYANGYIIESVE